ncbi:MAG: endonuclease domain-containing protein [Campylobacteraceae bacterium]|nr:endonuclease domain-containing protein [Campylobacteraceae bacterium]
MCDSCNTGLGRFKDSADFLQKVIDYLKKYK